MIKSIQLILGCPPDLQYEYHWLTELLHPFQLDIIDAQNGQLNRDVDISRPIVLVESGLPRLNRHIHPDKLLQLSLFRQTRLSKLRDIGPFLLIHLSDEEGLDADNFYHQLPQDTLIWRNFHHPRLQSHIRSDIRLFPIGPRREFFGFQPFKLSSTRKFPWSFMGTLWHSSQRFYASSLFLKHLPQGLFYGGDRFGSGIPLLDYKNLLLDSVFSLCPEGDRHFDTFRLYESLQMGCLPLVVERNKQASFTLGENFPLPIFHDWMSALHFVRTVFANGPMLDTLQLQVLRWWLNYKSFLSCRICDDLHRLKSL